MSVDSNVAVRFVGVGCLLASAFVPNPARGEDRLAAKLDAEIEPKLAAREFVGIVVGVIEAKGRAPRYFSYGSRVLGGDEKPDERTVFEIGSITKAFTGIALARMTVEGKVSLDEPLESLLPEGTKVRDRDGAKITLEHLATHASGLPRIPPKVLARAMLGRDPYAEVFEQDLLDHLSKWTPTRAAGATYDYSNLGAGLLGAALARRSGATYGGLLRTSVLDPLGLRDTSLEWTKERLARSARPHASGGKPAIPWSFDALAGCGGLKSTASDMMRFLAENLEPEKVAPPLDRALRLAAEPRRAASGPRVRIGLGWHVTESATRGTRLVWHNGGTGGYRSFAGFEPKTGRAVVVLGNTDAQVDDLARIVLDELDRADRAEEETKSLKKSKKNE